MGFLDRILGNEQPNDNRRSETRRVAPPPNAQLTDEQALERYRYMIRTAPPEAIEQAHAEAFERLTPEQRQQILAEMTSTTPPAERAAAQAISPEDPRAMGRLATRTEMRQPGFMERALGGVAGGGGPSLLGSFAMGFLGSMVAHSFFSAMDGGGGGSDESSKEAADSNATDESTADADADQMEGDADVGGDDFGGGDFGGGDFDV